MAAATYDIRSQVGKNRPQDNDLTILAKRIDFSKQNLANGESAEFLITPKNFVYYDINPVLKTAEGAAGTVTVGTEADPNGILDAGDVNGTPAAPIAKAGTEAIIAGTPMSEVPLRIVAASADLANAIVDVVLIGYVINLDAVNA